MGQHRGRTVGAVTDQTFLFLFYMIIKYHSHAFVLCANKLIVNMQNAVAAGNGKMMTRIVILSFQSVTLSLIVLSLSLSLSLSPSLSIPPSHVNKHNRPKALLTVTALNTHIPPHTCTPVCFDGMKNGRPFLRIHTHAHTHTHTRTYCTCRLFNSKVCPHSQTPHEPLGPRGLAHTCQSWDLKNREDSGGPMKNGSLPGKSGGLVSMMVWQLTG